MLNKEDRLRQIKQVLIKFLPVVKENFPWLDITDLHIGRFNDWDTASVARLTLYFQPATDAIAGNPVTDWRNAKYYDEIYNQVGSTLRALPLDEQITYVDGGTWSGMRDVPGWTPAPYSYYGIRISINFNDFKVGDFVKIKKDWLAPGKGPNLFIYRVTQVSTGGRITVSTVQPRSQNSVWAWLDYMLYKI